jgi:TfoX/Sxy family transcriptional regulator of competence genes
MAWRKAPESLVSLFRASLPDDPRVEHRKMFGYAAAFTGGHLFAGLHQEDLILRLPEDQRGEAVRMIGARPFEPMPGRAMREYVALSAAERIEPEQLRSWLARSFAFARALPPKAAKTASPKRKKR